MYTKTARPELLWPSRKAAPPSLRHYGRLEIAALTLFSLALGASSPAAVRGSQESDDFTNLSLEQLGSIKVTSVSKKSESLNLAPAAISVITPNEIRRSGALTLPELLRSVPGVNVGKVDASQWAVTVRGFNDTFAQKLLVLMDGRSIYTPLFSGTFWQAQDTMLEDVDRVEVVRGPGGTVWGANAVNGVISIVSKSARETQGALITGGSGSVNAAPASLRYGGQFGPDTFFRIYGKYDDWKRSTLVGGGKARDASWKKQGGFRLDWHASSTDRITVQGDLFERESEQLTPLLTLPIFRVPPPAMGYNSTRSGLLFQRGLNTLARWSRQFSPDSDLSVQVYYDRTYLNMPLVREDRDTYDLDFRHRFQVGRRHEIVWGGGVRRSVSDLNDSIEVTLKRKSRADSVYNAFLQEQVTLVPDRLRWTLGTKIEHNDYTGFELQPGTRLSWRVAEKQTLWASMARAIRTPSQVEHDGRFNLAVLPPTPALPLPTVLSAEGGDSFRAEKLLAYELGYRTQPHKRLTLDVALFINDYKSLRGSRDVLDLSAAPNYAQVRSLIDNEVSGKTWGGELAAVVQVTDRWRLYGEVSLLKADLRQPNNRLTGAPRTPSTASPEQQFSLRTNVDLGRHFTLDAAARHVGRIPSAGVAIPGQPVSGYSIASYETFDVRLAWLPTSGFEFALLGQNLGGSHREFVPTFISTQFTSIRPSVQAKLTWRF